MRTMPVEVFSINPIAAYWDRVSIMNTVNNKAMGGGKIGLLGGQIRFTKDTPT
jgi:hypothetical protein